MSQIFDWSRIELHWFSTLRQRRLLRPHYYVRLLSNPNKSTVLACKLRHNIAVQIQSTFKASVAKDARGNDCFQEIHIRWLSLII